jgi:hypothetical protein
MAWRHSNTTLMFEHMNQHTIEFIPGMPVHGMNMPRHGRNMVRQAIHVHGVSQQGTTCQLDMVGNSGHARVAHTPRCYCTTASTSDSHSVT